MRRNFIRAIAFALLSALGSLNAVAADSIPDPAVPAIPAQNENPFEKHLQAGRAQFERKQYTQALDEFKSALALQPEHRDARFLCGLAAYWARQPRLALDYWDVLLDHAQRGSSQEWEVQRSRVMALSALSQDAADVCVQRLYELRGGGKCKAAASARGFAREHLFYNGLRAVVWEVFDERGESEDLWTCPVVKESDDRRPLRIIAVKAALMPGGTAGFALTEEGPGYIRVYQRWDAKPIFPAVQPLLAAVLEGKARVLEEKPADNAGDFAAAGKKEAPEAISEEKLRPQIACMQLSAEASRIVNLAARLRDVDFDVTRLARLSLTDPALAERMVRELKVRAPLARSDAAEFVDLLARAGNEQAKEVYAAVQQLGARRPYFDFVLLTAINTRGVAGAPPELIPALAQSSDFLVRQMALLILARQGQRPALEALLELAGAEKSDATAANILAASLQELLDGLPAPPPPGNNDTAALKRWRTALSDWYAAHRDGLKFDGKWQSDN